MSETILLGLALVAGVVVAVVAARIFIVRRHTPEFLATLLAPHLRIRRPQGEGPFPTVICFHGCSGVTLGEVDWLDVLAEQGKHVTDAPNSPRFAPKVMRQTLQSPHSKRDLIDAMNSLFRSGAIINGGVKMPNRHTATAIVRKPENGSNKVR